MPRYTTRHDVSPYGILLFFENCITVQSYSNIFTLVNVFSYFLLTENKKSVKVKIFANDSFSVVEERSDLRRDELEYSHDGIECV